MKYPSIIHLYNLSVLYENQTEINGKWIPARPLGFPGLWQRLRASWLVFSGKADALLWPEGQ